MPGLEDKVLSVAYDRASIRERNRPLWILQEIGQFLASSRELQGLLDGALARVLEHFHFEAGRVYLTDETGSVLQLAAHRGIEPAGLEIVKLGEGFTGKAALNRCFFAGRVKDLEDPRRTELLHGKGYEMVACVPLISQDRVVGVMNLATCRVVEIDALSVDLLLMVGNQIANAANNARLYEEIRNKKETIQFFAYSASHDLQSPAVGLQGLLKRFFETYGPGLDEKGRAYGKMILDASSHILDLTAKLNVYIASKEKPLEIERVPLAGVLETVHSGFAFQLQQRGLRWSQPVRLPEIEADRTGIVRFLQNCVDNAIKYGGEAMSEVRLGYREDGGNHILSVTDDGVGMDPGQADRVFELFHRNGTSRGIQGAGLGMAIAREIAQRHGGRVWVETAPGKGAAFYLSIPKGLGFTICKKI